MPRPRKPLPGGVLKEDFRFVAAGTQANIQQMYPVVRDRLVELDADPTGHVQRKLTPEILNGVNLPIAMSLDHQEFVREQFGREIPLFNRVCFGRDEALLDLGESLPDWKSDPGAADRYVLQMANTIWDAMPSLIENIDRFTTE